MPLAGLWVAVVWSAAIAASVAHADPAAVRLAKAVALSEPVDNLAVADPAVVAHRLANAYVSRVNPDGGDFLSLHNESK